MKILVTGHAGFIGFHLARKLLERGDDVVGFDVVNDYYDLHLKKVRLALLQKEADDFSKSYCKDAVTDLNHTDKTLQSYFAGLGGLYDQRLEKRKADFKTLYNVTDETGEDLIYEAHPKEVVVSDSIGRGGLVENGLEQKRQTHGVALSAPTGNYRANYASRHDDLKKLSKLSFSS